MTVSEIFFINCNYNCNWKNSNLNHTGHVAVLLTCRWLFNMHIFMPVWRELNPFGMFSNGLKSIENWSSAFLAITEILTKQL